MIGLIGVNHQTAPLDVRELFAFSDSDCIILTEKLRENKIVDGAIILSTCNRTEIYYESKHKAEDVNKMIVDSLLEFVGKDVNSKYFHQSTEKDAVKHIFRLASGLESMVIGETQILGQLKDAFRNTIDNKLSTSILSRLFHKAFETGKLIRTNFLISSTPLSAGSAAVNFIEKKKIGSSQTPILILGVGQMAKTVLDALRLNGYENISIYNRTKERAEKFSLANNVKCLFEKGLTEALTNADIVYVATSSLTPIVKNNKITKRGRNLCIFDLSVPRNVSGDVAEIDKVNLYTIDDLKEDVPEENFQCLEFDKINEAIENMVSELYAWIESSELRSIIASIQEATSVLLNKELSSTSDEERENIEAHLEHFRTTIYTAIVTSTKEISENARNVHFLEAINRLFKTISKNNG